MAAEPNEGTSASVRARNCKCVESMVRVLVVRMGVDDDTDRVIPFLDVA